MLERASCQRNNAHPQTFPRFPQAVMRMRLDSNAYAHYSKDRGGCFYMAQPQTAPESPAEDVQAKGDAKREVSSIGFPYNNLDDAVEVAKAIHALHGSESEVEQIAAFMKQSPKSSGFRIQLASAKTFGLVTGNQGIITLTRLGSQICDTQQEKAARVEAFLTVPLYKEIYNKFKESALPPDAGLEAAVVSLGVAQKQKERARQVFKRSAQQAGFFQFGTDRLVRPAIRASTPAPAVANEEEAQEPSDSEGADKRRKPKDSGGGGEEYHPFIQGLLRKLPQPDTDWPADARAKWLHAAINIFDLMYTDSDDSRRSIIIELRKDSAK